MKSWSCRATVLLLIGYISLDLSSFSMSDQPRSTSLQETLLYAPKQEVWLTVFVHGIMSFKPHVSVKNLVHLFNDQVEDTVYAKTVDLMRKNAFFYKNQAMQEKGLLPIECAKVESGYASGALAHLFDQISTKISCSPLKNYFYTFGWSGIISHACRKKAAQKLQRELTHELGILKQSGVTPRVRIIGYSHGGNVALNMAFSQEAGGGNPFTVDELILLGTPIQCENDHLVASDLFKRVFNIYSAADRIQCLDCFSNKRFFSRQIFKARDDFKLPDKLTQVQLRATSNVNSRISLNKEDREQLNLKHPSVISGQARFLRERSPGHAELWFFGWTPQNYRKSYPLYPLPTVAVVPYIIEGIKKQTSKHNPNEVIIADLRPEYKQIILRATHSYTNYTIAPFLSVKDLKEFEQQLTKYIPREYTREQYNKHIYAAFKVAKEEHSKNKKDTAKESSA